MNTHTEMNNTYRYPEEVSTNSFLTGNKAPIKTCTAIPLGPLGTRVKDKITIITRTIEMTQETLHTETLVKFSIVLRTTITH